MATTMAINTGTAAGQREALQEKLMAAAGGAMQIFTIYLGDQLGYYKALAAHGPLTAGELAHRTNSHPRYAREWLEQQTVAGILEVDNPRAPAALRHFRLPEGAEEVLADDESLECMAGMVQCVTSAGRPLQQIVDAYRTGRGIPFEAYGRDAREGIARMNRPMYRKLLGTEWLPAMPDVDQRLRAEPPARVADIGCGCGDSSIGMAMSYPLIQVDGFDLDAASIEDARENVRTEGLGARVRFEVQDAAEIDGAAQYDLVTAFECIHDLPHPVETLRTMRRLVKPGGAVFICDERVGDHFPPQGEDYEWLMYGFSVLHCLPTGMCGCNPAGTGTVMRTDTLREYARQAGFESVEVLPIDHMLFRFYRLR